VVKRTIKIAVTGTHSTGKTTFVTAVQHRLETDGYTVATVSDLGAEAMQRGFPILHDHTPRSTLWIMARGISLELEAELHAQVILVDRPVPDALGYYWAALAHRNESCPRSWAEYLISLAGHHVATYDAIFKTQLDPTIPLGRDKPRDPDGHFRALADQAISDVVTELRLTCHRLTPTNHAEALRLVIGYAQRLDITGSAFPTQGRSDQPAAVTAAGAAGGVDGHPHHVP
jgi:hypothetical protein